MAKNNFILEESLKNKIARIYFDNFDCTDVLGKVDFCVSEKEKDFQTTLFFEKEKEYYLWAEAKKNKQGKDIYKLFVQLILTIGKNKDLRNKIPPKFLGAFDSEQMAFVLYSEIQQIFNQNDFNWNVAPSDYSTKEFKQVYELVQEKLKRKAYIYKYKENDSELKKFIKRNFKKGKIGLDQIEITQSNFVAIYTRWLKEVKNSINIDWNLAKKNNILDADFYLADVLSENNKTVTDNLFVLLKGSYYEYNRQKTDLGINSLSVGFKDKQQAHSNFWLKYKRPPVEKYQDYIIQRKDLLVPQDIRERKGSYFTPQIWVQKSQEYLAKVLGNNWQDEYYIWDCCAGTGNMENGLVNKYRVWASTLDQADVDIMKERAKNGANLLEEHIFQMDFLNDEFKDKCPKDLLDVIADSEKRKKLIIYINPPYKEATSATTVTHTGNNTKDVAISNKTYKKYCKDISKASNELFAQFFIRIYNEIPDCILGEFSKLKILQASNFCKFRNVFRAKLKGMFAVPADTFDNVKGQFPIGFMIWDISNKEKFLKTKANLYDKNGNFLYERYFYAIDENKGTINNWIKCFDNQEENIIGYMENPAPDFQNNKFLNIASKKGTRHVNYVFINDKNIIETSIYFSVRQCIKSTWINDRDQFLYPNDNWKKDKEFQSNCLVYALFHGQNRISTVYGTNHWIPYKETEVLPKQNFESNFITDYIKKENIHFSNEAKLVFESGKELWKYYHSKDDSNPNASFYDIREYFQGKNNKGKMNNTSEDETYSVLMWNLQQKMKNLSSKIIPKIYEYGFLQKVV